MAAKGCFDSIQGRTVKSLEDLRVLADKKSFVENRKVVAEYTVKELLGMQAGIIGQIRNRRGLAPNSPTAEEFFEK